MSRLFNIEDGAYSAIHTEKAPRLDITAWKEKKQALAKAIDDAVRDTQSIVVRAYPDRILMTKEQYADLSKSNTILEFYDEYGEIMQDAFLYRTPYNIMEVEVKE